MMDMVAYAERLPRAGETIHGRSFSLGFGGKGANQAVMCSLLGAEVSMVACIGTDLFGDLTLENFAGFSVRTEAISRIPDVSSGVAPIWVDDSGSNRIIIIGGANDHMSVEDVDAGLRLAGETDVILCQLEIPVECVERAFTHAQSVGSIAVLNPAPMVQIEPHVLKLADWIIPNETELRELAGLVLAEPADSVEAAAQAVVEELGSNLVITLGEQGALLSQQGVEAVERVDAPVVEAIDTTGAGDAFVGAFCYELALGAHPQTAARMASACAASSVTRRGTQSSFPRELELGELKATYLDAVGQAVAASPESEVTT